MIFKLLLVFTSVFATADGYKILAIHAYASKSHLNVFVPVINEIANRGHQVTFLQPYAELKVHHKIKMLISMDANTMKEDGSKKLFDDETNDGIQILDFFREFTEAGESVCRTMLTSDPFKHLLNEGKKYDIIIVNYILNECGMAVAPLLGNHTIYFAAGAIPNMFRSPAPLPYAAVPNHFQPLPSKMNFMQRVKNTLTYVMLDIWFYDYHIPAMDKIRKELVPQALSIRSGIDKISLYITNVDPVIVVPRPTVPNYVALCCPHCQPPKPLPQDLEKFVSSSGDDGFIIFGLGSFAQSKFIPKKIKQAFLDAFGRLKQKVIWKFEDPSLKTPPNVLITSWMPQQDLLGHEKIKLFITHGGLLSLQETTYHGVPVIGIPLFADQPGNVAYMEELGLGGQFVLKEITAEVVYRQITKILNDPGYYQRMKKYSAILKDHNKGTIGKGADWIEYVARHDGAWHLRTTGQDMNVFKYFLLDVILFILGITLGVILTIVLFVRWIRNKLKPSKVKKS